MKTANSTDSSSTAKAAIIGAGPAGLATARALKALNIPFDIYEKHRDVGGIWNTENPGSPMYRSAHFISSKTQSGHLGFAMPDTYPDYPDNTQILDYIRSFARHFGLIDNILFEHKVLSVTKSQARWCVTYETEKEQERRTCHADYEWVICANGTNWHPNKPVLPGAESFAGSIIHSVDYHDSQQLIDKNVLIVGAGNSGVDIACDAAFAARSALISLRRGYHFVPKHIFGMPADVFGAQSKWMPMAWQQTIFSKLLRLLVGDLKRLGLPKPDHKILSSHPILNSQILHYLQHGDLSAKPDIVAFEGDTVRFSDNSEHKVDLIILATGYHWDIPYLPKEYLNWSHHRPETFMKVFNSKEPSLFLNGFIETDGGAYKLFDEMAGMIAQAIDAQRQSQDKTERLQKLLDGPAPDLSGGLKYVDSDRHAGYTNSNAYRKAIKRFLKEMRWRDASEVLRDGGML